MKFKVGEKVRRALPNGVIMEGTVTRINPSGSCRYVVHFKKYNMELFYREDELELIQKPSTAIIDWLKG